MTRSRTVKRKHQASRDDIADLVTRRPLPNPSLADLDPFLFLNHHGPQVYPADNDGLPFGPHPHRGFETVTFILEGDLTHRDSGGHESTIQAGGVQWMTAGRGLIHAELSSDAFKAAGGPLEILQLWVNLPAALKLTEPRYVGLQRADLPTRSLDDGRVTVTMLAGTWEGLEGPFEPLTDIQMMTVALGADGRVKLPCERGRTVFLYVARGSVSLEGLSVDAHHLVELNDDGDEVALIADKESLVLFGHATPYGEPVVSYGPFVMNTQAEIQQAVQDYQAGLFGPPL